MADSSFSSPPGKWRTLSLLALAELLAMSVWFSASAVVPQLTAEWNLSGAQQSWLTMSVQVGFVAGALLSAVFNLADRVPAPRLIAGSAFLAAAANAAIPLFDKGPGSALFLRFLTGMALAGVYPPGMKLVASWCREDRGLGIGLLVGAITLGSGVPHLLNAFSVGGMPPWRTVLLVTTFQCLAAGAVAAVAIRPGPFLGKAPPFDWRFAGRTFADRPTRLANFGYLGHMWELYAMWAWVPLFLLASYDRAGWSAESARLAGFGVLAVGAAGSVLAGLLADRLGRSAITVWSLAISGACSLAAGLFFGRSSRRPSWTLCDYRLEPGDLRSLLPGGRALFRPPRPPDACLPALGLRGGRGQRAIQRRHQRVGRSALRRHRPDPPDEPGISPDSLHYPNDPAARRSNRLGERLSRPLPGSGLRNCQHAPVAAPAGGGADGGGEAVNNAGALGAGRLAC